ncbi:GNAT family N-acetyltransferase [Oryzifoliimicrobium ureilyticus]|uniref:GNAT family N-acetyltransferase n=1 Tax=Oryzifoliimicrobium ureilyticus TaxID=3113724 RepID=UPI00307668F3
MDRSLQRQATDRPDTLDDKAQAHFRAMLRHPDGPVEVSLSERMIHVSAGKGNSAIFERVDDGLALIDEDTNDDLLLHMACGVIEALFATQRDLRCLTLLGSGWHALLPHLLEAGLALPPSRDGTVARVLAEMFWQHAALWMPAISSPYPRLDIVTGQIEHPIRPPKPRGLLYQRYIPWLHGSLSFDVATLDDLSCLHGWLNQSRVNEFWNEAGSLADHERYLTRMIEDPHVIPLIGRFEDEAFSYFEIYWAKEDIIGPYCSARDYDRGCHVIVGEERFRGRQWFTAWLPSLLHLMFLSDPRTQAVVQEPSASHHRQLKNLQLSGFSHIRTAELPGKRAAIMSITRQHFFSSRLWHPADRGSP